MSKIHVIVPRPESRWEILIFEEESEDTRDFLATMEEDGRPYYIADQVLECLGPSKGFSLVKTDS